jgi:hypothetical protein
VVDIEHVPVDDDPREWSDRKKVGGDTSLARSLTGADHARRAFQTMILAMVSIASLAPTMGASIYNPAFNQLRDQLHATETQLSLSLSLFILCQGGFPVGE